MAKTLYFDCFSGASGDMVLGALLDLGLPLQALRGALGSLAIDYGGVSSERVLRAGVSATKFRAHAEEHTDGIPDSGAGIRTPGSEQGLANYEHAGHSHDPAGHPREAGHSHHDAGMRDLRMGTRAANSEPGAASGESRTAGSELRTAASEQRHHVHDHAAPLHDPDSAAHHHHHHDHHSLKEIAGYIGRSALSAEGKERALHLFERLAEAEAAIHALPIEKVHLHEVGALDSIIDIVGAVYGMEWVGAATVMASPLNVGSGTVECAHGTFPVPAPATVRLLQGVPIYAGAVAAELVTPTGALLVTGYASSFGPLPPMRVSGIGYGAGTRDFTGNPNVLRLLVGEGALEDAAERILSIECEIDDMNPQLFGPLMDRLSEAGALDVFYAAVQMKKNRPGTLVTVLAEPAGRHAIVAVLFAHTTTIGVRYQEMLRDRLDREIRSIETPIGAIRFKVATRDGRVLNAAAEFDDCARVAAERGLPIKDVLAIATKAWLDRAPGKAGS